MSLPVGSSHLVFCPPQPGKPNPNESWDLATGDTRSRVAQSPQKVGETCFYYALNMIRTRIGKHPALSQIRARANEVAYSNHRKRLTQIDETIKWQLDLAEALTARLGRCTKQVIQHQLKKPGFTAVVDEERPKCRAALEVFCKDGGADEDFSTFTHQLWMRARQDNNQQLYDALRITPESVTLITRSLQKNYKDDMEWILLILPQIFQENAYGLQRSLWHPTQPITALMEQLRQYGPHVVKGTFGQFFYQDPPFRLSVKVEGRSVFGWRPDAKRKDLGESQHAVTVIGARSDSGHVYFIDPLDGSDPRNPETQKIYVMSYEKFKAFLANLYDARMRTESGEIVFTDPQERENCYALHARSKPSLSSGIPAITRESQTAETKD